MEFRGNYLTTLLIFSIVHGLQAWRSFVIDFTSYKHELNEDYLQSADVQLVAMKGHNAINGTFMLKRDIQNVTAIFDVIIPRTVGSDWSLMNVTFDVCPFLEKASNDKLNLPYLILGQLQNTKSFFPRKCPLEKDKLIYVEDLYLDADKFPPYMPDMPFRATLVFRELDDFVVKVMITGSIQSKRANSKNTKKKDA